MRFSAFAFATLAVAILPSTVAATSTFKSTLDRTSSHMSDLSAALDHVSAAAKACGNHAVVSSCASAHSHLSTASSSWSSLSSSSSVLSSPWTAGSTSQASQVQSSLASCGSVLDKIENQIHSFGGSSEGLKNALSGCKTHYSGCQSGVTSVCSWPGKPTQTGGGWGPSQIAKGTHGGKGGEWRRSAKRSQKTDRDEQFCPGSEVACPISALAGGVECVDTSHELTSCGGCSSVGEGEDCTAIDGAAGVGCSAGSCVVFSCAPGYFLNGSRRCSPVLVKQFAWA